MGSIALPTSTVAAAVTPVRAVVINELYYNAVDGNPASEYIELYNPTSGAYSLQGWCIDGINYCFGAGAAMGPGVIVTLSATSYTGGLSNGGERIRLRDNTGAVIDEVNYDDSGVWPASADGEGYSLQRRDATQPGDDPGNWAAAPPTPGARNGVGGRVMPYFTDVSHTVLPAPNAPIVVTARLVRGTGATLFYRVGFGPETPLAMAAAPNGMLTASIPGQAAGALVRYRLADNTRESDRRRMKQSFSLTTWPVQGDGAWYTGTTVATSATSTLLRFEWFMEDATYNQMIRDLTLRGDDGYPCVVAYGGAIFDNSKVRVKGQVSRTFTKKKLKFILAPGHEMSIPGVLPEPVDEWAMHSAWNEKSFLRETLASEMLMRAGVPTSQAFPVRLERNGQFYGVYTYVEQQDGTWRDRYGFSDDYSIYEVGGGTQFGLLLASDANLSQNALRAKYDKETREWENDNALRTLIASMNSLTGAAKKAWIYRNVDVPSLVNALAMGIVLQHHDWGHKNYRLVFTPQGKWMVIPTDFDLTFGRKATFTRGPFEDFVEVRAPFEHPGTPLFNPFWFDAELDSLVDRRVRTLTEQLFDPTYVEGRIAAWNELVRNDAAIDRFVWGTYGEFQVAETAAWEINGSYVAQRRTQILTTYATNGRVARSSNPAFPDVRITGADAVGMGGNPEHVLVGNFSSEVVDISGYRIDAIDLVVPGGTVLRPGVTAVFASDTATNLAGRFTSYLYGGVYGGDVADAGELLVLAKPSGDPVHQLRHGPAPVAPPLFDVVVNEVAPVGSGFLDEAGDDEPWFELFNRSPITAQLAGATLSAAPGDTWVVPAGVTIPPGGHLLVIADGETGPTHLHAPTLLSPSGGTLTLVGPGGSPVSEFTYGAAVAARTPSGSSLVDQPDVATPGTANPVPRARVVLNEYNGVRPDVSLKNGGSDTYFGAVVGNGGDWLELVVVTDHVDLRGWRLDVVDNAGAVQQIVLPDELGLADVRAGTIVTVTDNPAVPSEFVVDALDRWINVNVAALDVSHQNTTVTILDADERVVFGPAGEGAHPLVGGAGIGSDEIFRLDQSPTFATVATGPYLDGVQSTFGSPNVLSGGGVQDFTPLLDTSRPGTPTLLGIDGFAPVITWSPPVGAVATGYRVYRNGVLAATTAALGFRDTRARHGTTVTYTVEAVLAVGGVSGPSGGLAVTVPDLVPPTMSGAVTFTNVVGNSMRLNWPAGYDAAGVVAYRVFINGHFAGATPGNQLYLDMPNMLDIATNVVEVYAIDGAGLRSAQPARGTVAVGDGTAPGPVRGVSRSVARTSVTMYWGFAADMSSIVRYEVRRIDNGQVVSTAGHGATFTGLTPNTAYTFHIVAIDSKGNVGSPAIVQVRTAP